MGLSETFFRLHDPQTPLYQENITILYLPKGPDRILLFTQNLCVPLMLHLVVVGHKYEGYKKKCADDITGIGGYHDE